MRQREGSNFWLTLGKGMKERILEAPNDRLRTSAVFEPDTAGNIQIEVDIVTNLPRMAKCCDEKYLEDLTKAYDLAFCSGRWLDFDPKREKADFPHDDAEKQQDSHSDSFLLQLPTIESRSQPINSPATRLAESDTVFEEDENVNSLSTHCPRKDIVKNPEDEQSSPSIVRPDVRRCHSCSMQERWKFLKEGMPPIHEVRIINGFAKYFSKGADDKTNNCTRCHLELLARKARTINSKVRFTILPVLTLSRNGIVPQAWSTRASNGRLNRSCNGGWSKNLTSVPHTNAERLGWETISGQRWPSEEGLRYPQMNSSVWILKKLQKAKQEALDAKLALQKAMVKKDYLHR
ncbi:hypothetical protein O6H91_20G046900 [Diphasiastrum complanatum]|uniref:Uncharacterized protein n=1 Tax=Diphasiastrum complanatum TaxID=34168 RepID=A0ACC2ARL1_DIPCM|nr:hypothetical protein O6H91_20G046900 [Diphasiastrum complanatum]